MKLQVGEQVQPARHLALGGLGLGQEPFHFLPRQTELIEFLGVNAGQSFTGLIVVRVLFELAKTAGGLGGGILRRWRSQRFRHEPHPRRILPQLNPMGMHTVSEGFTGGDMGQTLAGEVGRLTVGKERGHPLERRPRRLGILASVDMPFGNLIQRGRHPVGPGAPIGDPLFEDLDGATIVLVIQSLDLRQHEGAGVISREEGKLPIDFGDRLGVPPPFAMGLGDGVERLGSSSWVPPSNKLTMGCASHEPNCGAQRMPRKIEQSAMAPTRKRTVPKSAKRFPVPPSLYTPAILKKSHTAVASNPPTATQRRTERVRSSSSRWMRLMSQPIATTASTSPASMSRLVTEHSHLLSDAFGDAIGLPGAAQGGVVADEASAIEIVETGVHEHHAVLAAGLHRGFEHVFVALANEVADGAGGDEDFVGQHAAGAVDGREQILRDDALQGVGELHDDLPLEVAFKDAGDALKGVHHVGGMQGGRARGGRSRPR